MKDMYPEGWLIDSAGKTLLLFQKKPSTTKVIGTIQKWQVVNGAPFTCIGEKKVSAVEAIAKWIDLTEDGWRRVDKFFEVEAA